MFALAGAALIGASLGLERYLRGLAPQIPGAALAGVGGWLGASDLLARSVAQHTLFFPLAAGAAIVAVLFYLAETMKPVKSSAEGVGAYAAPAAFGLLVGLGANRIAGAMGIIALTTLAWRAIANGRGGVTAPGEASGAPLAFLLGRPEKGRHDDESGEQGEEQRNRQ